jgi:hypothetical protein
MEIHEAGGCLEDDGIVRLWPSSQMVGKKLDLEEVEK